MARKKKQKKIPLKVNATFEELLQVAAHYDKKKDKRKLKKALLEK